MADMYQPYLSSGPINYMADLFVEMFKDSMDNSQKARQIALEFYGPIFLLMNIFDNAGDKKEILFMVDEHVERFARMENLK